MHVRNTHAHIFTQTTFFGQFFYADYPKRDEKPTYLD